MPSTTPTLATLSHVAMTFGSSHSSKQKSINASLRCRECHCHMLSQRRLTIRVHSSAKLQNKPRFAGLSWEMFWSFEITSVLASSKCCNSIVLYTKYTIYIILYICRLLSTPCKQTCSTWSERIDRRERTSEPGDVHASALANVRMYT